MLSLRVSRPSHLLGVFLAVALLAGAVPLLAQLGTGVIEGAVLDPDGAVIPGAEITVRNAATGIERALTTDATGHFRAVSLEPGIYEIKATKSGFRIAERKGVQVVVGSTTTADLTLQVGAATETVTVTESAPVIDTEKTDVTSTVSEEVVANVPVIGRRFDNYVLLTPGVSPDGSFGLITYRGVSGLYNNNTLDGADNNQAFFSEAKGRTRAVYTYSQASIKEFQVGLSNFNAEYGRAAGGLVNAVTKSGTNAFHGEAFYFIRDDITSAREPTIPVDVVQSAIGSKKLPERRQQFGFAMGGPIKQDKLFWFLNYDQQVRNFPYFVNFSSADFIGLCPGATVVVGGGCAGGVPKTPVTDCSVLTNANQMATCLFFFQERTVVGRSGNNNVALGRLDWTINANNNLAFYYNYHKWRSNNGIRTPLINFNAESDNGFDGVRTDALYLRWNSVISSTHINELRFLYGRDNEVQRPNAPGPGTSPGGGFSFGMPNFLPRPAFPFEKRFQVVDNFSWLKGRHAVKFGFDINYVRDNQINLFQGGGVYSYSNFAVLAGDCPPDAIPFGCVSDGTPSYSSFTQAFDTRVVNGGLPLSAAGSIFFTTTDYNFYVQDTFKVHPHVTLNYGIRYEYQKLPQPDTPNPVFPLTARFNQDKNNWGPRLGVAWDIAGRHKTILRAGYGLIYGRTSNSALSSAQTDNGFLFATLRFFNNSAGRPDYAECFMPAPNTPCTLPTPVLTGPLAQPPDIFQLSEDFARPYVHQAEASIEHEIFKDTVLSATYAFSGAHRLPLYRDINMPAAASQVFINLTSPLTVGGQTVPAGVYGPFPFYCVENTTAPMGNCPGDPNRPVQPPDARRIMQGESVGNSNYNALILRANRRMSRGVLFDAHLTWSHAIDDGQNSLTFFGRSTTGFDPLDRNFDRSDSDFDIRRRFVATFVWRPDQTWDVGTGARKAILGDWAFSGSVTAQDLRPITSQLSGFLTAGNTRPIDTGSANGSGGDFRAPFVGRNFFDAPNGLVNLDFRVSRSIRLNERMRVELIAESFNLLNRVNFVTFDTTGFSLASCSVASPCGMDIDGDPIVTNNFMSGGTVSGVMLNGCGTMTVTDGTRCLIVNPAAGFLTPRTASSTLNSPREFQFAIKFFW